MRVTVTIMLDFSMWAEKSFMSTVCAMMPGGGEEAQLVSACGGQWDTGLKVLYSYKVPIL
jgi:hypothetical protein